MLELLAMTLAHLNDAEARREVSPRVPLFLLEQFGMNTATACAYLFGSMFWLSRNMLVGS
ncbi:MAG: hypothetical protein QOC92_2892 [Acidimicrobiaceae bacterium]